MANSLITFQHDAVGSTLEVHTGANAISWSYQLNTQSYPTYGGEVVQILSAYIDNLTIQGETRSYAKMEEIYGWFITYFQKATSGMTGLPGSTFGQTAYVELPVKMTYLERGWTLAIQPTSLPNLAYGTNIVVPTWQLEAVVLTEDGTSFNELIDLSISENLTGNKAIQPIGFDKNNPFQGPSTAEANAGQENADYYNGIIASYNKGDYSDLVGSIPATPTPTTSGKAGTKTKTTTKTIKARTTS